MPNLEPVAGLFLGDPILAYSLLAALFLAAVSVTAGLTRLDVAALAHSRAAIACALCAAGAILMRLLLYGELATTMTDTQSLLAGLERFPLVVAALAYGPIPGVLVVGLYATFAAQGNVPAAGEAVLALEMALVGWLAIYPSPREHRWAGPLNALLAYLLAWSTAGLALIQWQGGNLEAGNLLAGHEGVWLGVLVSALLLLLIRPADYARLFPHSRILEVDEEDHVIIAPLSNDRGERDRELAEPNLPGGLGRPRRGRRSRRG